MHFDTIHIGLVCSFECPRPLETKLVLKPNSILHNLNLIDSNNTHSLVIHVRAKSGAHQLQVWASPTRSWESFPWQVVVAAKETNHH